MPICCLAIHRVVCGARCNTHSDPRSCTAPRGGNAARARRRPSEKGCRRLCRLRGASTQAPPLRFQPTTRPSGMINARGLLKAGGACQNLTAHTQGRMHRLILFAVLVLSAGLQAAEGFTAPICAPIARTQARGTLSGAPAVRRRLLSLCFAASWLATREPGRRKSGNLGRGERGRGHLQAAQHPLSTGAEACSRTRGGRKARCLNPKP